MTLPLSMQQPYLLTFHSKINHTRQVIMKIRLCFFILATYASGAFAQVTMAPDGSYVSGSQTTMAPDGSYVGGSQTTMAPDGSYVGGSQTTMAPDGSYVGGTQATMAPDGSYVGNE